MSRRLILQFHSLRPVSYTNLGKKTGANGVFLWENVELKRGVNALEARSDTGIDYADIRVL